MLSGLVWASAPASAQSAAPQESQAPLKVAILPVVIHSGESLEYLKEGLGDMLSSRIELPGRVVVMEKGKVKDALDKVTGELDAAKARELGRSLGVDFVVFGSLTKLGDSSSLDLRIVDVKGEKAAAPVYVQMKKMEEVIAQVDNLALKVDEKILGYPLRPAVAEKAAAPAAAGLAAAAVAPAAGGLAAAGAASKEASREIAVAPAAIPGFRPLRPQGTLGVGTFGEFFQSVPFPFKVKGMSIGDLDGDGRNEVAMISDRVLWIYRWEQTGFKLLQKIEGSRVDNNLAVDVGDIDKDGKEEIFVTNIQQTPSDSPRKMSSFVVAYREGTFKRVASEVDWFLRVVDDWRGKGKLLLGQRKGEDQAFKDPIYQLSWDGKKVKEVGAADLPKGYSLFGFASFKYQAQSYFVFIDSQFRLKVTDPKGKVIWRGRETYGSDNAFEAKPLLIGNTYYEGDEWAFVNVRVIARGNEILIIRNLMPIGDLFKRQKYFNGGLVEGLVWNGAMFLESWKSPEISGYVADIQIGDLGGVQGKELVMAVNLQKESFLSTESSSALMIARIKGSS
jgi:TolB-like protein